MKKFFQWPYVKRHFASKGIADIVAIKSRLLPNEYGSVVVFIQCKYSMKPTKKDIKLRKVERDALIKYAADCGAIPIFAYNQNKQIILINLNTNMGFIP